MQLMSWTIGRLGSRFGLHFEPYRQRVMHSAMGRFLDQPLDLCVGLIQPDGVERVFPFTRAVEQPNVELLSNCEQFERMNSITFAGYCEAYRLRLELNIHSVFYPQNDRLCVMPAFYLELRVSPLEEFRDMPAAGPTPDKIKVCLRLQRPDTRIEAVGDALHLHYDVALDEGAPSRSVAAHEKLVSINPGCQASANGEGLELELPVTRSGAGVKWRLVWAAHVAEPVLNVRLGGEVQPVRFRYTMHWDSVDQVAEEAVRTRDERLALSRRFEKLLGQAPLDWSQRHLMHQAFQCFLSNTWWCHASVDPGAKTVQGEWFSVWDGSCRFHSPVDVEYNNSIFYFTLWPRLLKVQLLQWAERVQADRASGGVTLPHDLGHALAAVGSTYAYEMPVEENSNFLLLLETYARWTGDTSVGQQLGDTVRRLVRYLAWTDRDQTGFPSAGVANTLVEGSPAVQFARKQTYLAVKRVAALRAGASLLRRTGQADIAREVEALVERDTRLIEEAAWLGDHYAVTVDASAVELSRPSNDEPLPFEQLPGWDAYSIHTPNGLLLPEMVGQPPLLDRQRLMLDVHRANRECQGRYGDGHTSIEPNNCRISQNLWRDMFARYLMVSGESSAQQYWDLQIMSNTHTQSMGYTDTHVQRNLQNYSRGVVAMGYLLSTPRLMIDRLSQGATGVYITVHPDRHAPQRWPLLPLADWQAGKIPVCVVTDQGRVSIEAATDPVIIHSDHHDPEASVSGIELIG